ncbi:MAG: helix-turn-helix domain-containing protein [Methyloceanibacter sp.]|uniref:helix-turn-helix domain-containing protein n=1 Tax=Methyloceanibacter sp. TaxID=1965321 RepID=UPI003D6D528D
MFRFSSNVVEPRERIELWDDFLAQTLAPFRTEPAGESPFHVEIGMQMVGDLPIVNVDGRGYRGARGKSEIARSREHFYVATVHVGGAASLAGPDKETSLARGDVFVLDTMHELEFGLEAPYRHLLVKVPKEWLEARVARPDLLCGSVLTRDNALAQLFASYLAAGFLTADRLSASAATMFAQHLIDLLAEAFAGPEPDRPAPSKAWRAAMLTHACRLMALKFGDPDLNPQRIAEQLGISTRMLHRIFAEHGETVMQHLLTERLDRAAKLLGSPHVRHRGITEIAFACGFNDLTHFGRVFAERMGMPPSQWRKQAL